MFLGKDDFGQAGSSLVAQVRRQPPAVRAGLVALPLLALLALGWWLFFAGKAPAAAMPPAEVAVAYPLQRNIVEYDEFTGRFEPSPFAAALAEAQARAASARTAAALAQAELARAVRLIPDEAVSREEVDNLRAAARSAHAGIAAADAVVRQRALDLDFTNVRAPISGKISYRRVDP